MAGDDSSDDEQPLSALLPPKRKPGRPPGSGSKKKDDAAAAPAAAGAGAGAGAGHHVLADGPGQERVYLCKAESQLVNGVNYRLTLGLDPARPAQCHTTAVVYKSFQGVYQVPPADETPTEGV
eukprot:CAMPEP_0197585238 /NCGR_PEP_ID=MMETSP1326-20131121/7594_1 /TAXON_ID=1155430 /ORGANISM="Genus nov. species nov., Strain RCC2288" /LENGTH=122 /DNA_ID=CAMNT_0043149709 /DNA_START=169 /DNA_END=537 /DNA_ORIENTATION=-